VAHGQVGPTGWVALEATISPDPRDLEATVAVQAVIIAALQAANMALRA